MPSPSAQKSPKPPSLLYILFSALGVLWLLSKLSAPDKKTIDSISPRSNSSEEHKTGHSSFTTQVPPAPTKPDNSCVCRHHKTPLWKILLEVATFIAAVGYAGVTYRMWREMQTQTGIAHDQFEASNRPWIKTTNIELRGGKGPIKTLMFHWPLTGAEVPPSIQVHLTFANVGHSVARNVEAQAEFFFGKFVSDKWHDVVTREQERFCRSVSDRAPSSAAIIIFPSDSSESFMGIGGIVHDADIMRDENSPTPHSAAVVITCINYQGGPETHYQTQTWSGLYEDRSVYIPLNVDVDASRLQLIREQNGDHAY